MIDTNNIRENTIGFVMHLLRIGVYLHRMGDRITGEYGLPPQQFIIGMKSHFVVCK